MADTTPSNWIKLTDEQKASFETKCKDMVAPSPGLFNLSSDSDNAPGRFGTMTPAEISAAAEEDATWLLSFNQK